MLQTVRQSSRAFSLVELTVTMMVLAVGATVALPRLAETVTGSHVQAVAKTIQCDLELARRTAMNRGRVVTVQFDWDNATYHSTDVTINADKQTLRTDLVEAYGDEIHLTSDFDGPIGVRFDPTGSPSMIDADGNSQTTGNVLVELDEKTLVVQIRPGLSSISLPRED
jgi:prepilin-type N-terminal cleavage/methylation domain-containing protein